MAEIDVFKVGQKVKWHPRVCVSGTGFLNLSQNYGAGPFRIKKTRMNHERGGLDVAFFIRRELCWFHSSLLTSDLTAQPPAHQEMSAEKLSKIARYYEATLRE